MRALFLALVLINAGFFYWQYTLNGSRPTAPQSADLPQDDGVAPLQLLSEAKPDTKRKPSQPRSPAPDEPPPPAPVPAADNSACYIVGPFPGETEARTVMEDFVARGVDAAYTPRPQQRNRYWLHTPPLPDLKAAEARLKQLNEMGFHDVVIMPAGDLKNSLSLGFYHNQSSAEQRMADLKAKGVNAIQAVQQRTVDTHWVRYQAPRGDAAADAVWEALSEARPDVRREEMPCQ